MTTKRYPWQRNIPSGPESVLGKRLVKILWMIFVAVAINPVCVFSIPTIGRVIAARSWIKTPCVILRSGIETLRNRNGSSNEPGDEVTTYELRFRYSYRFGGQPFTSDCYQFFYLSRSDIKRKNAIVRRHRAGSETFCYVNPRRPNNSVIDRGFTPDAWQSLLVPSGVILWWAMWLGLGKTDWRVAQELRKLVSKYLPVPGICESE